MKDDCLCCQADQGRETRDREKVSGLWSVKTRKLHTLQQEVEMADGGKNGPQPAAEGS
jgi:hypothetical protein